VRAAALRSRPDARTVTLRARDLLITVQKRQLERERFCAR
jgi:hypothetical protein